jgi:hypothetical protein
MDHADQRVRSRDFLRELPRAIDAAIVDDDQLGRLGDDREYAQERAGLEVRGPVAPTRPPG